MKVNLFVTWVCMILALLPGRIIAQELSPSLDANPEIWSETGLFKGIDLKGIQKTGEPTNKLTFHDALALSLLNSPELNIARHEIKVSEAEAVQESKLPNPEFEFELENFSGRDELAGFKSAETLFAVGQSIELAGKRKKRSKSAELNHQLTIWDYRQQTLSVYAETAKSYLAVLAAQEKVLLSNELKGLAEKFRTTIEGRVNSGGLSKVELSRANIEVVTAEMDLGRAKNELQDARMELASLWGKDSPLASSLQGTIAVPSSLPEIDLLETKLSQNPGISRLETEQALSTANFKLGKANGMPDADVSLGYRHMPNDDNGAFVAGFSIPIPLFNRNTGANRAAAERVIQTDWMAYDQKIQIKNQLKSDYRSLELQLEEIQNYEQLLTIEAQNAFEKISDGYNLGKYDFLDVLDAQRVLSEIRRDYMDLLLESNLKVVDIEVLINQKLSEIDNKLPEDRN